MNSYSSDSGMGDGIRVSGFEEDLQQMDQKKRNRMISNRESARRSRLRKQSHVNSLMALAAQLREEESQILGGLHVTTQLNHRVEAENTILMGQAAELSHQLLSLNEIARSLNHGADFLYGGIDRVHELIVLGPKPAHFYCGGFS